MALTDFWRQHNGMMQNISVSEQSDAIERGGSFYLDLDAKALALYPWQDGSTDVLYMQPVGLEYDGPMVETPYGWKVPLKNHTYGATHLQLVDLQSAKVPDALENYLGNGVALIYSGMPVANIPQGEWIPKRIAFSGMVDDCIFAVQDPANFLAGSTYPDWVPYSIAVYHLDKRNSGGHWRYTTGKITHLPRPIAIGWLNGQITGWAYGEWRQVNPTTFDKVFLRDAQFDADMTRRGIGNPQTISVSADLGYSSSGSLNADVDASLGRGSGDYTGPLTGAVTVNSLNYWSDGENASLTVGLAMYSGATRPIDLEDSGTKVVASGEFPIGSGPYSISMPTATALTFDVGKKYWFAAWADGGSTSTKYDDIGVGNASHVRYNNVTGAEWSDFPADPLPAPETTGDDLAWSMWADYTIAVALPATTLAALTDTTPTKGDTITLSATITDGDNVTTAAEYFVGIDPGEGNGTSASLLGGSSPFTISEAIDTTAITSGAYTVSVRGFSSDGWGAVDTIGMTVVLGVPQNVVATPGDEKVTVGFTAVTGATVHKVFYSATSPVDIFDFNILQTLPPAVHTGLTNGDTWYYAVSASDGGVASELSAEVSAVVGAPVVGDTSGLNIGLGLGL